ncbi:MAG: hypothetical protein KAQ98_14010 [Bacteriovoracaceae bacterium]|nr:hypothetical protein [Bacteriovoracaceae bacterium]
MKHILNPFIDDSVVSKDDYCSRKNLEERITKKIENGHNVSLIGDRRVGKTSTAHYVVDGIKGVKKIDIDLYHIQDSCDVAEAIIDSSKRVLDEIWDAKKVIEFAKRVSPKLDISEGGVSFGVATQIKDYKKTLNVAFEFLNETIKRSKGKVVILFDEFQEVRNIKNGDAILKYMRGKIQKISRVPFIYVGSIRHDMEHIFRDQSSPFFKQAEVIYFEHIEPDIFFEFISKKFKKKDIVLEREVYDHLYEICYGITGDIQTFCRVAFDDINKGEILSFDVFFGVIDTLYKNEQKYFKKILDGKELSKVQKNLIIQLALIQPETGLFAKDFQKVVGVKSPGSVRTALSALEKKEYIYKSDDSYCFANPFFKEWILDHRLIIKASAGIMRAGSPLAGTRLDFGYRYSFKKK